MFGLRRAEVTEGWRKLHNEEFHNLYPLPSIIRNDQVKVKKDEMGRACSTNEGEQEWV
jgi:hypothetical protein